MMVFFGRKAKRLKRSAGVDANRLMLDSLRHDIRKVALNAHLRYQPFIHQALVAIDGAGFELHQIIDATADGHPLGGQNRDLGPVYQDRLSVSLLRPTEGPAILMHSVPGELGGTGLNAHGLSLFANSLWATSGRTWMAPPLLRRAALECADADAAVERIQAMDGPAVGNFLLIDAAGRMRNLEILPEGVAVIARDSGAYAHANNCTAEELLPHELPRLPLPGSEGRRNHLQHAFDREAGNISVEVCKRLLSDETGTPEPVCRRPHKGDPYATVAGLITEPAAGALHISFGPPSDGRFATHRFEPDAEVGSTSSAGTSGR